MAQGTTVEKQQASGEGMDVAVEPRERGGEPGTQLPDDTLTLAGALRTAVDHSPDLSASRARLSGEEAGRWADWGAFLPRVRGQADFDRTDATRITFQGEEGISERSPEPLSFTRMSANQYIRLEWTLLEGGRRIRDFQEGRARVDAARHRISASGRGVVARVKRAYFEALKQERLTAVARRQLEARRQELAVTRERVEAGVGTRTDLLGARVEEGEAELALLDARNRAEQERRRLRREMGLRRTAAPSTPALLDVETLPDADGLEAERLIRAALASDPEIRALEADARAASATASMGWTRYVPEVRLSYGRARSESQPGDAAFLNLDPSDSFGTVGLSFSWDLFGGFDRREESGRAHARLGEARAESRERRLEIEQRVGDLLSEIRRRAERLQVLERNVELAAERLELARESYRAGIRTFDELQVFIDEDRSAQEELSRERYEYLKRWADLEELTGPLSEIGGPAIGSPEAGSDG